MMLRSVFCCALLAACAAEGAELFVAKSGNDKNPGSEKAPFATIGRAAAVVRPGDTVKIGPGIYREQVNFRRSGKKDAPIVFAGTRGPKGEFLTVVEAPGTVLSKWTPALEIHADAWKTPIAKRPDLIMMDGAMITYINPLSMALPRRKPLPKELNAPEIWSKFVPGTKRLPGLDFLSLPADIKMTHPYMNMKREPFFDTIGNVLSGWHDGVLYVRFAKKEKPQDHRFTASYGTCFSVTGSYLTFRDLHLRGSRRQIHLWGGTSHNTVEKCLLMHGGNRILIGPKANGCVIRGNILTAGFIRSDLFQLRSDRDMRGGMLYQVFKYVIGTASSDDVGIYDCGRNTKICGNLILQGLIGMDALGVDCEVAGNVVREMSSIGICTGTTTVGKFHDNLVMNCGIPLRIHDLRHARVKREEYHYRNLFVQDRHAGSQIYVHCSSHTAADKVNFDPPPKGGKEPVYKQDPPDPVDAGKFYIYHNTFWGGHDKGWNCAFYVRYLSKRFRMVMPFYELNNIFKDNPRLGVKTHELAGPDLLYTFDANAIGKFRSEPEIVKNNKVLDLKASLTIWNKNDLPGLPDVTLAPNSPALEAGVDISRPFTVNGKSYPALPGFAPGYFKGKAPAAGALQAGESMERFIVLHRRAEEAVKMLSELKEIARKER